MATETLSFPGLGLSFDINRVAFYLTDYLGGRPVYWYGIIIACAFLLAIFYVLSNCKRFGLDSDRVMDVVLGSVIAGIVGARAYYVAFSWDMYRDNPVSVLYVWEGGLAIYGAIIISFLAATLLCKLRRVKTLPLFDLAVGGLILGQAIGRWGNFINIEAFGSNTSLPWGMTSNSIAAYLQEHRGALDALGVTVDSATPVHPTFLYESLWCFAGFLLIAFLSKRRRFDGQLLLTYLAWYGLGRFLIEGLRTDSLLLGSVRISQLLALCCFIASAAALIVVFSKIRREADPDYLKLYVDTDEGKEVVAGTYYDRLKKQKASAVAEEKLEESEEAATEAEDEEKAEIPDEAEAEIKPELEAEAESQTETETETESKPEAEINDAKEDDDAGKDN